MKFCSHCGAAEVAFKTPEGDSRERYICNNCNTVHYQNPKIVVGCLPIYEDKVLLCRRNIEPQKGFWNLPAGFMENDETVEDGAKREVWEEVRAKVELERLFVIFNILPVNQVYMIFLAHMQTPEFEAGDETTDVKLFLPHEIPFEELAFESNRFVLDKYMNHRDFPSVHFGTFYRPL